MLLRGILSRLEWCASMDLKYFELCALSQMPKQYSDLAIDRILLRIRDARSNVKSSSVEREDLLFLGLVRPLLHAPGLARTLDALLRLCSDEKGDDALLPCLAKTTTDYTTEVLSRTEDWGLGPTEASNAFQAWLSISRRCQRGGVSSAFQTLCAHMEKLICQLLADTSSAASFCYLATLENDTEELLETMIRTRTLTGATKAGDCLLAKLVGCDPHRFAIPLVQRLFEGEENMVNSEAWNCGAFDEALLHIVKEMDRSRLLEAKSQILVSAILYRSNSVRNDVVGDKFVRVVIVALTWITNLLLLSELYTGKSVLPPPLGRLEIFGRRGRNTGFGQET